MHVFCNHLLTGGRTLRGTLWRTPLGWSRGPAPSLGAFHSVSSPSIPYIVQERESRLVAKVLEPAASASPSLVPAYPEGSGAPIRTAKAERRQQERLRMQSPELPPGGERELSPAEKRALEAEKRAMWRAAR